MKYPVLITLACLASCAQQPKEAPRAATPPVVQAPPHIKDSILIFIKDQVHDSDQAALSVSYDLESDTPYNKLLTEYIKDYEFGGVTNWPDSRLDSVANRESFLRMVLLWYGKDQMKKSYPGISYNKYKDEPWLLEEIGSSLLFAVRDCCRERFYRFADTLLTQDDFSAVLNLWDSADLHKLPSLTAYVNRTAESDNFMVVADLAAFFHNQGRYALRDSLMIKAGKIKEDHKQFLQLKGLIAKDKQFSYATYGELLYHAGY